MNTNFDQLKQLFLAAVEQHSPDQWDAYLDEACGQDAELRRQAAMLLRAHVEGAGQGERTSADDAKTSAYGNVSEQPGTVIGQYKLLEQIGEGGFGLVFMAEQTEPIHRKVALKILKPGMDTRQVVARFEAERQALAIMDHPNIAKVLDAGATPTGRPYFVMELVKGVPITEFCDQNHLTARQRLELFIAVCQAVQHAHQKGVIHRDLKPSNVLVSVHDTTPVPKVIDFGIAKALGQELTDKTLFTGFTRMVGTPLYMSPEQAGQSSLDIDTRSDIYSLGVLLYELLTGTTPFDKDRFKTAAYEEIRRIIREEEPPKPSTRLSASDSLPSVSAQRQTEPAKLTKLVRGDLDWIVMKALEKDRNRRYETANSFAMDVQRYLNDEAVLACPPSAGYLLRKFVRRNKAALLTTVALALVLVVGTVVSAWQAIRAGQREQLARRHLYAARMNLAHQEYERGEVSRALKRLEAYRPFGGQEDLRGFEWYYLWRMCHHGHLATLRGHAAGVNSVAFSPDGDTLASASADGTVKLWDVAAGRALATLRATSADAGVRWWDRHGRGEVTGVLSVAYSADGRTLASSGCVDGTVKLWDVATGNERLSLHGHKTAVTCVAFCADQGTLATTARDGTVMFWDPATGRDLGTLQGVVGPVHFVAFAPDGRTLATGGSWVGGLFDVAGRQKRADLEGHRWEIYCGAFSPDGKTLVTGSHDRRAKLWDVASGQVRATLQAHTFEVLSVAYSPDGKFVATGGADGAAKLWDLASLRPVAHYGHLGPVTSVAFSPDGKTLATGSGDGSVKLWRAGAGRQDGLYEKHSGIVWSVAISPDSKTLASAGDDGSVKLTDVATGEDKATLDAHKGPAFSVTFSPDGKVLASAGKDPSVRLWDPHSAKQLAALPAHPDWNFRIRFTADGKTMACLGVYDGTKLWDVGPWQELSVLPHPEAWTMELSPDSGTVLVRGNWVIKRWDLATRQEKEPLQIGPDYGLGFALSLDGKMIADSAPGGVVRVWSASGRPLAQLTGHSTRVDGLAFSPDGKRLAVAGYDGMLKLWDVDGWLERATLKGHGDAVYSLSFSPDGKTLVTGCYDGTVKFWRSATETEVLAQSSVLGDQTSTVRWSKRASQEPLGSD